MKSKFSSEIIYFNASDDILKKEGSYYEPPNIKIVHKRDIPTDLPILASTSASSNVSEITNLVTQPKKEYKKINCGHDCYEGSILMDNLHGTGFYYTEQGGRKYFYDGMFYINKLEGYGQVFYDNGSHFQGLFKTHFRYGPGVLTHSDGTQDVGFWHGFKLIRLTCPVGGYTVPTLASTPAGKCKLLSYKYIVPIKEKTGITMKQALENIGTSKETFVQTDAVFNLNIRNPDSSFFHKLFYDEQFFGSEQGTIKVYVDKGIENCEPNYESKNDNKAILERIDNLKIKIHEVNETLQTLIVIRQNLESRCKKCQLCCQSEDSSSEENETTAKDLSKNDGTTNNLEEPFFDASANSLDIEILEDYNVSSEMPSLIQISKSCTCNEDEYKNGLRDLEEQLQNIQKQEMFYKSIRDELKKKLDKITQKELNKHQNLRYKLVEVNELWAWNNENSLIEIQKHCFKHQHSEDMVNFSVPNLILGNRKDFAPAGEHEQICQNFLLCCSKGRKEYVNECLKNNSVHPNMADSRGNTGIFFAAVKNRHEIISTLVNFGVKLDQFNDDQLTPLSMSLLRYIYLKNNCQSWERAFLPETKPRDLLFIPKWYKVKSFQSITSVTSKTSLCFEQSNSHQPCSNMKIVNLLQQLATNESEKGIALRTQYNSSFIFDMNCKNSPEKQKQDDYINNNLTVELEAIQSTIMTLLYYGTNPNVCETPYPPLILTLFTGNPDLVKAVIEANAQISVQIEDGLSCLHVAASLPPKVENANIYTVLTKYGCSPKARTSPTHWQDRKLTFTGKIPETFDLKDEGKTPLHLLCMRTDYERKEGEHYFCTIAKTILNININIEETYLGHTPLSLAMLSGNIALVKCFLKTNIYDPHKPLQYGMGNILTLYALKRFDKILPLAKCKEILTVLMNANMNVLNKVYESENAIVFTEDRDNYFDQFTDKTQKIDNNSKRRKEEKNTQNHAIKEFLKSIGRQIIIKQVQLTITDIIFLFIEEDMLEDSEISIILSTVYLTPQIAIENLKGLFEYGKIEHDRLDPKNIRKFFEFVSIHNKLMKKDKRSKEIKKEKRKDKEPKEEKKNTLETMVKEFDVALNLHYAPPKFLIPPGLDDLEKYTVCFHCLRGQNKKLKTCPRCQLISFCSLQCNKRNMKLKSQHGCNILFYDMTTVQQADISKGKCLNTKVEEAKMKCKTRLNKIRELKLIEEEEKLLEMWRNDIYGTKFLQIKPLLYKVVKNKGKDLSWNVSLLRRLLERNFKRSPGETSLYCLENILLKLQSKDWYRITGKDESADTLRTKQSWSTKRSTLGGSSLHSTIFQSLDFSDKTPIPCKCTKKIHHAKAKLNLIKLMKKSTEKKFKQELVNYITEEPFDKINEAIGDIPIKDNTTTKKLMKIPSRYQRFMEILGTYFPDSDFSFWLLPYACCSGGQLFYKFCYNNDLFKESYSFS